MPRTCSVCTHAARPAIDAAIVERRGSIRDIALQHGLSKDAVARHGATHISDSLTKATEAATVAHADDLLGTVRALVVDAKRLQGKAEQAGDLRTAIAAVREQGRIIELLGKLLGEIQSGSTVTVNVGAPVQELGADQLEHLAELALQEARELRASATVTTTGHALEASFSVATTRALDPVFQGAATTETTELGRMTGAERDA